MENTEFIYDDEKAAAFIMESLPENLQKKYDEDDILYILDILYDYYESTGAIIGEDEDKAETSYVDLDPEEMMAYILEEIEKDDKKEDFPAKDIEQILLAELDYCKSIGILEEDGGDSGDEDDDE